MRQFELYSMHAQDDLRVEFFGVVSSGRPGSIILRSSDFPPKCTLSGGVVAYAASAYLLWLVMFV
jgi:hypothetical protein